MNKKHAVLLGLTYFFKNMFFLPSVGKSKTIAGGLADCRIVAQTEIVKASVKLNKKTTKVIFELDIEQEKTKPELAEALFKLNQQKNEGVFKFPEDRVRSKLIPGKGHRLGGNEEVVLD
jgi:hypothetical protein